MRPDYYERLQKAVEKGQVPKHVAEPYLSQGKEAKVYAAF